ncbi:MAG TPA: hypothetical protein VGP90_11470 [Acidimicrobiia bacterium]|nr:hypothetical protein [Acidimicrobiia bacterium]
MADDDLARIDVRSGVNEAGDGFLTVIATTQGGRMILGQLDPATVRRLAMDWLEAAEAAEQDAAVLRCIRKLGLPEELAGAVVAELRNSRAD